MQCKASWAAGEELAAYSYNRKTENRTKLSEPWASQSELATRLLHSL